MLLLYRTLIRFLIDYLCILIHPLPQSPQLQIDSIQYRVLRICLGALISTPTNALLIEAVEPPITLPAEWMTSKFLLKECAVKTNPLIANLHKLNFLTDRPTNQNLLSSPNPYPFQTSICFHKKNHTCTYPPMLLDRLS